MIASRLTVRRLLNRLPEPQRASLQDIAHAAAMSARASHAHAAPDAVLSSNLAELAAWQTRAHRRWSA